jgi:pilus assembly protein CpaF
MKQQPARGSGAADGLRRRARLIEGQRLAGQRRDPHQAGRQVVDAGLLESVRESMMAEAGVVTPSRVAAAVQATGKLLGTAGALAAVERISAELNGLGPLQSLTRDPAVTDIFVNAPDSVWVDRGRGIERVPVAFGDEAQLRALACRLVAAGGRRLDDGSPCVDVRLAGGYRIHAVLPPVSTAGTLLSVRIRRERCSPWTSWSRPACSARWLRTSWNGCWNVG